MQQNHFRAHMFKTSRLVIAWNYPIYKRNNNNNNNNYYYYYYYYYYPKDPGSSKLRMVMGPKYLSFRFGDYIYTPTIIIWLGYLFLFHNFFLSWGDEVEYFSGSQAKQISSRCQGCAKTSAFTESMIRFSYWSNITYMTQTSNDFSVVFSARCFIYQARHFV